jgi:hypothetical protein
LSLVLPEKSTAVKAGLLAPLSTPRLYIAPPAVLA